MEESESKVCPNCKREIPTVNFTIHTVHCARNIKVCPVCKEPVPQSELQEHHDKLHKLMPCKQCGESVCGTDLEDHVRDSCGHTIKSCRYCELELPRHELPAHEGYCGVRTEQCGECREWVMIKYRQLHLDSNHGFLRLDDDPVPQPKKIPPKLNANPIRDMLASTSNGLRSGPANGMRPGADAPRVDSARLLSNTSNLVRNTEAPRIDNARLLGNASNLFRNTEASRTLSNASNLVRNTEAPRIDSARLLSSTSNLVRNTEAPRIDSARLSANTSNLVRNTEAPRIDSARLSANTSNLVRNTEAPRTDSRLVGNAGGDVLARNGISAASSGVGSSGAAIGARVSNGTVDDGRRFGVPIPTPSSSNGVPGGSGDVRRTLAKRSNDQPQINTAVSSVNKVHKDMATSRGAVKKRPAPKPPADRKRDLQYYSALQRQQAEERQRQEQSAYNATVGLPPVLSPAAKLDKLRKMDALHNREVDDSDYKNKLQGRVWMNSADTSTSAGHRLGSNEPEDPNVRNELRNLKPMTPAEFMARFEQLQLREPARPAARADRFSEIKSSLRELRRGLNEVTAPYNSNSNNHNDRHRRRSPSSSPVEDVGDALQVDLPCEFCGAPVPADDLVQHQTGCRPDLTQFRPRSRSPQTVAAPRAEPPPMPSDPYENPVIPCEFCTESLPVYLISEHQERCRRDPNMLFPD